MKDYLDIWHGKLIDTCQRIVKEWDTWTDNPAEGFEHLRKHIDELESGAEIAKNVAMFSAAMDQIGAKCYGTVWRKSVGGLKSGPVIYEFVVDHNELIEVTKIENNGDTERFEERITGTIQLLGFLHNVDPRLC